jgi:tripartite-type tricarboxylate transporter receptor subunit TctC
MCASSLERAPALRYERVNQDDCAGVRKALEDPAVRKRIEDTGSIVIGNTPEQFAEQMAAELAVYKKVVVEQKLKLDQ